MTPEPEDVEKVLEEFESRKGKLESFCAKAKSLIEGSLEDAGIKYRSVQWRVKSKKKLRKKYLDPEKNYKKLDDITNLAGLRVITYYEDEVDAVANVINREFEVDPDRSIDKRITEPDRFSYRAINYVCRHLKKRLDDVEYKKYIGVWCEIQITSILQHAWSEIEHEWYDLKDAYPDKIKRRLSRLVALFELAESEFLALKMERSNYQKSIDIQVAVELPDVPLDPVSMRSLLTLDTVVAEFDREVGKVLGASIAPILSEKVVALISKSANLAGLSTVNEVRVHLRRYRDALLDYVVQIQADPLARISFSPSTLTIRGISVDLLSNMLLGGLSEDKVRDAMKKIFGQSVPANLAERFMRQAAIARKVLASYGPRTNSPL